MKRNTSRQSKKHNPLWGLCSCVPFAAIAYFCKYVLPGYSFSALVCAGIIAVILFYTFLPMAAPFCPRTVRIAGWVVSIGLVVGISLFAITEGFIIHAAFGNPDDHADYLVVLGAKVRPTGPSVSLQDRIDAAVAYLNDHPDVIAVVSGGQGDDEVISEAECMYLDMVRQGIAPECIWMEDKATSTDENLRLSLDLIQSRTGERPVKLAVLSSEYHLFRAGLMARKLGISFVGVPARTSRVSQLINHGMREVAGVWHFFIFGR